MWTGRGIPTAAARRRRRPQIHTERPPAEVSEHSQPPLFRWCKQHAALPAGLLCCRSCTAERQIFFHQVLVHKHEPATGRGPECAHGDDRSDVSACACVLMALVCVLCCFQVSSTDALLHKPEHGLAIPVRPHAVSRGRPRRRLANDELRTVKLNSSGEHKVTIEPPRCPAPCHET